MGLILGNYEEYKALCSLTYDEAIAFLLNKYGSATDDYYREASYNRFMNNEIKSITKGKYSRGNEGLYCHHIDENIAENISNIRFIKANNLPFSYQKKERLVYCDLIEHSILHGLIGKETASEFGVEGLDCYLKPMVEEWFIDKIMPSPNWMKKCYNKAFLTPEDATKIIVDILKLIDRDYLDEIEQQRIQYENALLDYKKCVREEVILKIAAFDNLTDKASRTDIVMSMYEVKTAYTRYEEFHKDPSVLPYSRFFHYDDYKIVNSSMIQFTKERILQDAFDFINTISAQFKD